jgi:hypothetical protein
MFNTKILVKTMIIKFTKAKNKTISRHERMYIRNKESIFIQEQRLSSYIYQLSICH